MESIYDRLGDLLKETLEAGSVKFVRVELPEDEKDGGCHPENESGPSPEPKRIIPEEFTVRGSVKGPEKNAEGSGRIYHADEADRVSQTEYRPKTFVYKKLTPDVERAYGELDIPTSSGMDEIKKAYKDKIKYYHPDRYGHNETLLKVATEKTRRIVEAYRLISEFLEID
ncbi:MAG: J domain-containing protein [Treponema sp.]|nr:J domain-containing protein [Treponema sp.]